MSEKYRISHIAVMAVTDATGNADLYLKCPGTFNGLTPNNPTSNGLFIRRMEIWTDTEEAGAVLHNLNISDRDGVLPANGISTVGISTYPILTNLIVSGYTDTATASYSTYAGCWVRNSQTLEIITAPSDLNNLSPYQFLPSGLYIAGTFKSPSGTSGKIIRANFMAYMLTTSTV